LEHARTQRQPGWNRNGFAFPTLFLHSLRNIAKAKKRERGFMSERIRQLVADKHLRRRAVEDLTGLSRSTIYNLMSKNAFPRPVKLTGKAVAWPESKISEWLAQRGAA
jgi:prophage regulatory protein